MWRPKTNADVHLTSQHRAEMDVVRAANRNRRHAFRSERRHLRLWGEPVYGYSVGEQHMTAFTLDGEGTGLLPLAPVRDSRHRADRPVTKRALGVIAIWISEI